MMEATGINGILLIENIEWNLTTIAQIFTKKLSHNICLYVNLNKASHLHVLILEMHNFFVNEFFSIMYFTYI